MKKMIKALDKYVNEAVTWVVIIMLAVMSVVVFAQVLFRLVHLSITWSEELSKYLLIWATFLGASLCIRKGSMVGLEIMQNILPKTAGKVLYWFVQIATGAFLVFLIVYGFQASHLVWSQTTPILKMSMGLMYASIPVGSVLMLFNLIITTYYSVTGEGK